MAKLVECVPNFSEGRKKEVRGGSLREGKTERQQQERVLSCERSTAARHSWSVSQWASTCSIDWAFVHAVGHRMWLSHFSGKKGQRLPNMSPNDDHMFTCVPIVVDNC